MKVSRKLNEARRTPPRPSIASLRLRQATGTEEQSFTSYSELSECTRSVLEVELTLVSLCDDELTLSLPTPTKKKYSCGLYNHGCGVIWTFNNRTVDPCWSLIISKKFIFALQITVVTAVVSWYLGNAASPTKRRYWPNFYYTRIMFRSVGQVTSWPIFFPPPEDKIIFLEIIWVFFEASFSELN